MRELHGEMLWADSGQRREMGKDTDLSGDRARGGESAAESAEARQTGLRLSGYGDVPLRDLSGTSMGLLGVWKSRTSPLPDGY